MSVRDDDGVYRGEVNFLGRSDPYGQVAEQGGRSAHFLV